MNSTDNLRIQVELAACDLSQHADWLKSEGHVCNLNMVASIQQRLVHRLGVARLALVEADRRRPA
jgi:hypothetical protein